MNISQLSAAQALATAYTAVNAALTQAQQLTQTDNATITATDGSVTIDVTIQVSSCVTGLLAEQQRLANALTALGVTIPPS